MVQVIARANFFILAAAFAFGQSPAAATFEVASVKSSVPGTTGGGIQFLPGGRFSAMNVPLTYLLQQIYQVRDFEIVGAPNWMSIIADGFNARYEIQAKGDASATEPQVREMVKTLLGERFQLKVHRETRELPVYALIAAKTGVKLPVAKENGRPRGSGGIALMDRGWIEGSNVTMPSLIQILSRSLDRPVVDKTNFAVAFDFKLTWTPDSGSAAEAGAPSDGSCPSTFAALEERLRLKSEPVSCPSIFTAVQEQLGLKLDAQKAPVEVLVIDHAEHPSAN